MTTTSASPKSAQNKTTGLLIGLVLILFFTFLVAEFDAGISAWFKGRGVSKNPFEYPLTAVLLGLLMNFVLRKVNFYEFIRPAIKTELFLKVGLILMGSKILFGQLLARGAGGVIQAAIMVTSVFFFTWWLAGKLKIDPKLKAVMSTAVSVCGVSAAIAAAGSVLAKKEDITYVTALVIVTALPLMVIMPFLAHVMGLPADIAGAWFGGNIDTTAAVVGAGTIYGPVAQEVAAVVKMSQNVFIGIAAFGLAFYFVTVVERKPEERPSVSIIWQRFPKFVLGFILVSILASIGLFSDAQISLMKDWSKWAFAMAFFSIGLELSFKDLGKMGWSPVIVFLTATVFNTLLALGIAYLIFGVMGL